MAWTDDECKYFDFGRRQTIVRDGAFASLGETVCAKTSRNPFTVPLNFRSRMLFCHRDVKFTFRADENGASKRERERGERDIAPILSYAINQTSNDAAPSISLADYFVTTADSVNKRRTSR